MTDGNPSSRVHPLAAILVAAAAVLVVVCVVFFATSHPRRGVVVAVLAVGCVVGAWLSQRMLHRT